ALPDFIVGHSVIPICTQYTYLCAPATPTQQLIKRIYSSILCFTIKCLHYSHLFPHCSH
ncbi:hypothetical protein SK128_001765, partial [Halocaridina rubra]